MLSIAKHCPHLTTLDVSHCSVTDFSLFEIAERSTNLTYLGYPSHSALIPSSLTSYSSPLPSPFSPRYSPLSPMFRLYVTNRLNKCQQVTNEAIIRVTQHCTKLEGKYPSTSPFLLFFSSLPFLFFFIPFSFFLLFFLTYSHRPLFSRLIAVLKLGGLYKLGPEGLASAAHHCPSLVALDINGYSPLLYLFFPHLLFFSSLIFSSSSFIVNCCYYRCERIESSTIVLLAHNCPKLTSINLGVSLI